MVEEGRCIVKYVPTDIQEADILTKGLTSIRLTKLKKAIGMNICTEFAEQHQQCAIN